MTSRRVPIAIAAAAATLAVIVAVVWLSGRKPGDEEVEAVEVIPELETPTEADEAILYFPGYRDRLYSERRTLEAEVEGEEKMRLVIAELLKGPESEELVSALPTDLEVGSVTLAGDGTFYLDLTSKVGVLRGLGSTSEMLAVYSLVNTVLANEPGAQKVVLLWNGRQHQSFAGHVDTARPLAANRRLIAEKS